MAMDQIDRTGIDTLYPSTGYDLLFEGRRYPPKEVLRVAYRIANKEDLIDFSGGKQTNNVFIKRGFRVVLKDTNTLVGLNYSRNLKQLEGTMEMDDEELDHIESPVPSETEKERLIKERLGQSTFKARLLNNGCKCNLCGITQERFLIASHIKPWSESNNFERLDPNNGFLLCPNHDFLFDKGYISFDDRGKIMISSVLDTITKLNLNVSHDLTIEINKEQHHYIQWHRKYRFKL